ncbi:unnamed protein product [Lymnaea stagnalis]|uniref:Uncharacterized protein n=1 Tax=Lymnaea stagnalis TaxID=6523 RepID=A0AAV2I447_LYMST
MADEAEEWEAAETGICVDIGCNDVTEEREIKFKDEDNGQETTVKGERERILGELGQPVNNCAWVMVFSNNSTKRMNDNALVATYKDDLTQCQSIRTVYSQV